MVRFFVANLEDLDNSGVGSVDGRDVEIFTISLSQRSHCRRGLSQPAFTLSSRSLSASVYVRRAFTPRSLSVADTDVTEAPFPRLSDMVVRYRHSVSMRQHLPCLLA